MKKYTCVESISTEFKINGAAFDVKTLSEALKDRRISSLELTKESLRRCEEADGIGAFTALTAELAISAAKDSDERHAKGESRGVLDGIPFAIKDNLCLSGYPTTCGSRMLENFIPPYTATAVERLLSVGAVPVGKTNMDEFGMGNTTQNSIFGKTLNPLDKSRISGGSSGGSAAAVAAGCVPFALGSDTGGSVRYPAAFCGAVGVKPTYGGVSRYGLVAYASSFDTVGVISSDVLGSSYVLSCISGKDTMDMTSVDIKFDINICNNDINRFKIGVPFKSLEEAEAPVRDAVISAAKHLAERGAEIVDILLPPLDVAVAAYYVIAACEASSNLGRYDGVRYGYRPERFDTAEELFIESRTGGFGMEVKKRILLGTHFLTGEGRAERYGRALSAVKEIRRVMTENFKSCDALLMPVSPTLAPETNQIQSRSALDGYLDDAFCVIASLCGLPAMSIPFGVSQKGLPVGVQLVAPPLGEKKLYSLGIALEAGAQNQSEVSGI